MGKEKKQQQWLTKNFQKRRTKIKIFITDFT